MSHLIHKRLCEHFKLLSKENWVRYTTEQLTRVQQDVREFLPNGHALRNSVDPIPLCVCVFLLAIFFFGTAVRFIKVWRKWIAHHVIVL